jgi:hypothetical protein
MVKMGPGLTVRALQVNFYWLGFCEQTFEADTPFPRRARRPISGRMIPVRFTVIFLAGTLLHIRRFPAQVGLTTNTRNKCEGVQDSDFINIKRGRNAFPSRSITAARSTDHIFQLWKHHSIAATAAMPAIESPQQTKTLDQMPMPKTRYAETRA